MHISNLLIVIILVCEQGAEAERCKFHGPCLLWTEYDHYRNETQVRCQSANLSVFKGADLIKNDGFIPLCKQFHNYSHIAVDSRNKTIILFNERKKSIMARGYTVHGQPHEWTIFASTSKNVNGLSLDELTGNIYWTDSNYDAIFMSSINAYSDALVVIDYDLDHPYGIATFAQKGLLFWSDLGKNPKVEKSTLAGRNRKLLLNQTSGRPGALAVDSVSERLYWNDLENAVRSCDFEGNDIRRVRPLKKGQFWSDIVIYQDLLFGAQPYLARIFVLNMSSGENISKELPRNPYGLAIYDTSNNDYKQDPCENSYCRTICVSGSNNTADCYCRQKFTLTGNTSSLGCTACDTYGTILMTNENGLYSLPRNVIEADLSTVEVKPVYIGQNYRSIAVDSVGDIIFVFEQQTKVIKRIDVRMQAEDTIITSVGNVRGIAIDWISRNIYWTDSENMCIMVCDYDGIYPTTLIHDLSTPSAIAVHPERRMLFWSNNAHEIIETSTLAGSEKRTLNDGFVRVTAMTIDYKDDIVYVFDARKKQILCLDIDGQRQWSIVKTQQRIVRSIAVLNDFIIWDFNINNSVGIMSINKKTGGDFHRTNLSITSINGLAFHHLHTAPNPSGPCFDNNKCDQLCLPIDEIAYRCDCMFGYYLDEENKCKTDRVRAYKRYLIVVDQRAPAIFQLELETKRFTAIPVKGLRQPYAVAFDPRRKQVYWTDLSLRTINRAKIDGSCQEVIYADDSTWFMDIVVDIQTDTVLVTDFSNDRILMISMSTLKCDFVRRNISLWRPMGLVIIEESREIIVTSVGRFPRISRIDLPGRNFSTVLEWSLNPRAVAFQSGTIYWIERVEHMNTSVDYRIFRTNLDGSNVSAIIHSSLFHPRDIVVDVKHIYWTDDNTGAIWRAEVNTGGEKEILNERYPLFKPAGIALVESFFNSDRSMATCENVRSGDAVVDIPSNIKMLGHAFCIVPTIAYGFVVNNIPGAHASSGVEIAIKCTDAHRLSGVEPVVCQHGKWVGLPTCETEFEIYGDKVKGWTAYLLPGKFYAYDSMENIRVYCIGAGGGGYDSENLMFSNLTKAGDGGDSLVFTMQDIIPSCSAEGGKGGGSIKGGDGGEGRIDFGQPGGDSGSCQGGGSGCSCYQPIICGAGGDEFNCTSSDMNNTSLNIDEKYISCFRANGILSGGLYGGGAGSRGGGSGGGGGYDVYMHSKKIYGNALDIKVGKGGKPSFAEAGSGIVIITWGMKEDELLEAFSKKVFEQK